MIGKHIAGLAKSRPSIKGFCSRSMQSRQVSRRRSCHPNQIQDSAYCPTAQPSAMLLRAAATTNGTDVSSQAGCHTRW